MLRGRLASSLVLVAALGVLSVLSALGALGCGGGSTDASLSTNRAPTDPAEIPTTAAEPGANEAPGAHRPEEDGPPGDPARGRELIVQFECARCHDGTSAQAAPAKKHCVRCHQDVYSGKLGAGAPDAARLREHVAHLRDVPSLAGAGKRLRRAWIERFLLEPHDLRPALTMTMPRLALTRAQARDIAAHLAPEDAPADALEEERVLASAGGARGRALMEANGCSSCHAFSGVPPLGSAGSGDVAVAAAAAVSAAAKEDRAVVALAPDLRFARERLRPSSLVAWLLDPQAQKPDALMPRVPLSAEQARDIAAYVLKTPLAPAAVKRAPQRLPLLSRRVTFQEVEARVLGVTCRHCHSEPRTAIGDGGPGNGGGFGFPPRRLDLGSYRGVAAGSLDEHGERRSVFAPLPDGTPRLVAALMARHAEEAGAPDPRVRGMPLGLPAIPLEDIQLIESWIAQGRPQ